MSSPTSPPVPVDIAVDACTRFATAAASAGLAAHIDGEDGHDR